MRFAALAILAIVASPTVGQPPPLVAPTDALSPADEKKGFTVPAGFEVQLVASEPDIQKPMQMAFDAKGRLWVTTSHHYPFAVPQGKGTDKLFVLSDFDPETGKAKKVQIFASDLNIPIGVLPLPDCKSCLVSSTGEIRKYTDTDGDGKADKMEVLFTGFGYRDTHGMYNSFTLMPDGWVYACHGYLNTSKVKGKDGHEVEMNSGNTFRFRPDGSRIEVYTRGQVNPFGIAVDPWFNLYTADCHSKPITQLIPGAVYDSFGKPHDGLGFGPHVTRHDHGSTGLCGLAWYDADQFPKEYNGCMFVGNVVTSRINFDKIEWKGATPVAKELPDFMTSKDLWFRPVDIKLGPDGALYVADFYNKIIGHYEVDLKHPGRDKDHGRLWRIVWKGKDAKPAKMHRADFTTATDAELLDDLLSPNQTVRFLAGHQLRLRAANGLQVDTATKPLLKLNKETPERFAAFMAWLVFAAEGGKIPVTVTDYGGVVGVSSSSPKAENLTGHSVRALSSRAKWGDEERKLLLDIFKLPNAPHHLRAATEAVIFHPHADFVVPLVELLKKTPDEDTHLRLAAKIALRNSLREDVKGWAQAEKMIGQDAVLLKLFVPIAIGEKTKDAATFLANQFETDKYQLMRHVDAGLSEAQYLEAMEFVGRYGDLLLWSKILPSNIGIVKARSVMEMKVAIALLKGIQASGIKAASSIASDTSGLVSASLKHDGDETHARLAVQLHGLLLNTTSGVDHAHIKNQRTEALGLILSKASAPVELRAEAFEVATKYYMDELLKPIGAVLADGAAPAALREKVVLTLAANPKALEHEVVRDGIREAIKTSPYRYVIAVASALASSPAGAELLMSAVRKNNITPLILQEKAILEKLRTHNISEFDKQLAALTKGLPPLDQKIAELMKQRATAFARAKPDKELGAKLFTKHCGACHKIGDAGGKIAPQLDGVGNRGLERLLEDTLDPNRNVDQAFRARIITTKDERTITGLMLRVEGEVLVVANDQGKEVRIPTKDIDKNRETMLSPMPANFGDVIPEVDFYHLVAYLLDQRAKDPPK